MSVFDEGTEISFYDGVPDDIRVKHQEWHNLNKRLTEKVLSKGLPTQANFEITPLCNLSCKMCFVRLDKDKMDSMGKLMTAEQWKNVTEQTANLGTMTILITGGEPFIHPEFVDIYTNIVKSGFRVILYTNAVMLNDKIIETLKKYPPNYLFITIYGASEETYEKVCGNGKAYNSVVNNIKVLKDILKDIPVNLRTTVIKDNINDVASLKKFAEKMQIGFSLGLGTIKPVRGAERPDIEKIRLSPEEIVNLKKEFSVLIKDEQMHKMYKKSLEIQEENLLRYNGQTVNITADMKNLKCAATNYMYTISWDGKMLPCQNFYFPYTLPLDIGIESAWIELNNMKKEIKIPDRCIKCKYRYYCGTCPAAIQSESGTYIDNEPYKCMKSLR
jgi:radical SAM additional 4Fe4S-binding domain